METVARKVLAMNKHLIPILAMIAIPLKMNSGWQNLKFSHIPQNQLNFSSEGMQIKINKSSSPVILPLSKSSIVKAFKVDLEFNGQMQSADGKWPEDAYLRVGFVVPGQRRLGVMERLVAADWVKQLFRLAPDGAGVDKIYFYNLVSDAKYLNQRRILPGSKDLLEERIVAEKPPSSQTMTFAYSFAKPLKVLALWLSSDGDDTGSQFDLLIKNLSLDVDE